MPTISVIVVNYNGGEMLADALESLQRQTRPADEIIVVDNASTDGSAAAVPRFPGVELIRSTTNLGFTGGNNLGMTHARGDYIALLNSDAVADDGWLAELERTLSESANAAVAVGKILFPVSPPRIDQAGAEFNDIGNYWGRGYGEIDSGQYDEPAEVPGVTACAMLLRRSALQDEPLFDDSIFMYGEELDLSIRLRSRGLRILYSPRAVVWHRGMHSVMRSQVQPQLFQQFHANRNRLKILARYYPARILLRKLPLLALGLAYWNLFFLRHGGWRSFLRFAADEARYLREGFRQRKRTSPGSDGWIVWMKRQSLRDVLAMRRKMRSGQASSRD